ncbi:hypothetical protein PV327_001421 [Microctonus hyperodae]|uniref:Uncharacterized protein n=1 Tax=Microctonus hyperodae TaxID=165561 RepID=A0AA39L3B7_MICHY|nr:hypothetical protein PV327_001421 [Microctonus hyperodae]
MSASITLEMLRFTVEELQRRRAAVTSRMIALHLIKRYPVERNLEILKNELSDKLDYAVSRGILCRCNWDTYCLPSLRQTAYNYKTDFSSFWERYYKKRPGRRLRPPPPKNRISPSQENDSDDSSDYYSDSDDE